MTTLWFDCETFSECDLKAHGTHRYAEHESTEITVAQWAVDDGEPVVVDCTAFDAHIHGGRDLIELLENPTVTVVAHNSMFDRTLLRHCWGIDVPVETSGTVRPLWLDPIDQPRQPGMHAVSYDRDGALPRRARPGGRAGRRGGRRV